MKLLTFHRKDILQLGIRTEAGVIDVAQASDGHVDIPLTMDAAIRGGAQALKALRGLAERPADEWVLNEKDLQPGPCVGTHLSCR